MKTSSLYLLLSLIALTGCTGSRWARQDRDYAAKYPHHTDDIGKTIKQALDARHLKGRIGGTVGSLAGRDPATLGGQLGATKYLTSWLEGHGELTGLLGTNEEAWLAGISLGARVHTPSRVGVFAGVGSIMAGGDKPIGNDGLDNDQDGMVDEFDEDEESALYFAVYPEMGVHVWLTPKWRFTSSAAYHLSASGVDDFQWVYGFQLAKFWGGDEPIVPEGNSPQLMALHSPAGKAKYALDDDAHADIKRIYDQLATTDPHQAHKWVDETYEFLDRLSRSSGFGNERESQFQASSGQHYVVAFNPEEEGLVITGVHSATNYRARLSRLPPVTGEKR